MSSSTTPKSKSININVTPELIAKSKGDGTEAIYKAIRAAGFRKPYIGSNGSDGHYVCMNTRHSHICSVALPNKVTKFLWRMNAVAANPTKYKRPTSLSFVVKYGDSAVSGE